MYARTKVLERRREVTTLLVRGISPGEIAEILGIKRRTVYNDIRAVRSGRNPALVAHSKREIVAQLYLDAQARKRYLWNLADTAKSEYVMVRTMHELRMNDERITKVLPAIRTPAQERAYQAKEKEQEARDASSTEMINAIVDSLSPLTPAEAKAANIANPGASDELINSINLLSAKFAEMDAEIKALENEERAS